jgi:hypothetical protein
MLAFKETDYDLQHLVSSNFLKNPDFNTSGQLPVITPSHSNPAPVPIQRIYMRNSFSVCAVIHKIATKLALCNRLAQSKGAPHALY